MKLTLIFWGWFLYISCILAFAGLYNFPCSSIAAADLDLF